jgi:hypothetical protein
VTVPVGATSLVVNTTQIDANSEVFLQITAGLHGCGVPTNLASMTQVYPSAEVAGTSFTITVPTAPTGSALCVAYNIIN